MRFKLTLTLFFVSFNLIEINGQSNNDLIITFGGQDTLHQNFKYNISSYPAEAIEKMIEGTILITYDIDSTCSVANIRQDIKLGYGLDEATISSVREMEKRLKKLYSNNCIKRKDLKIPFEYRLN